MQRTIAILRPIICAALLALLLSIGAANSRSVRSPLFRAPRDAPTTGCYIVVLKEGTTREQLSETLDSAVKFSDDGKVYGYVEHVGKAFTLKLSPSALEKVRVIRGRRELQVSGPQFGLTKLPQSRSPYR